MLGWQRGKQTDTRCNTNWRKKAADFKQPKVGNKIENLLMQMPMHNAADH
jgi:hypothetical protein